MAEYNWIESLTDLMGEVPPDSIISRTLYKNNHAKTVLFDFDAGQSLSEHQAAQPAIIHILNGEATLTLGDTVLEGHSSTLVDMEPGLKHSIYAKTRLVMLLILLQTKGHDS